MVENLVQIELSHINTKHHGFHNDAALVSSLIKDADEDHGRVAWLNRAQRAPPAAGDKQVEMIAAAAAITGWSSTTATRRWLTPTGRRSCCRRGERLRSGVGEEHAARYAGTPGPRRQRHELCRERHGADHPQRHPLQAHQPSRPRLLADSLAVVSEQWRGQSGVAGGSGAGAVS